MTPGRDFWAAFDVRHKMFNPLWVRLLVTVILLLWALFEASNGALVWAAVFAGAGAYLAYQFFVIWEPVPDRDDAPDETD